MLLLLSHQVMSDSLRPLGLQHARLPGPSLSPRVCSDSSHMYEDAEKCVLSQDTSLSPPHKAQCSHYSASCFLTYQYVLEICTQNTGLPPIFFFFKLLKFILYIGYTLIYFQIPPELDDHFSGHFFLVLLATLFLSMFDTKESNSSNSIATALQRNFCCCC